MFGMSKIGSSTMPWLLLHTMILAAPVWAAESQYVRKGNWVETMLVARASLRASASPREEAVKTAKQLWRHIERDYRLEWDWALQDGGIGFSEWFIDGAGVERERAMIGRVLEELGDAGTARRGEFEMLQKSGEGPDDRRWLDLYAAACQQRRASRLRTVVSKAPRIVFTKHRTIWPSFFAYTEGLSDAQAERHFLPGSSLCVLDLEAGGGAVRTLLEDRTGAIRDPAVSYDGARILFAWKKSLDGDDYHLYEMEAASGSIRQLTFGLGHADYEPAYLPNGDIVFSSTRCVQQVDCFHTEVSNLYTCDRDGRFLRRLGFDQVHTVYPTVMDDGRVIYTRWDYNDRGQIFPQALFQMNADGSGQMEFYGNNSWFPTTIAHARGIPGSGKVVAIFCGHHSPQTGKLGILDVSRGRQENTGARLIAPERETPAERIDSYGQTGELFQYPYPLSETEFIVTYAPLGRDPTAPGRDRSRGLAANFGIYLMTIDGRRELLASDPELPCNQPFPLVARTVPHNRPSVVDHRRPTGFYYIQDIYAGPGLAGVPRGTIRKVRVIGLEFRAATIGGNGNTGPGGTAFVCTPVAIGNGTWDVKVVYGDAKVHEDGSAFFEVPSRKPLYFQAIDDKGRAAQTMRSWSTLQPGEFRSCAGCHDHKNSAPDARAGTATRAMSGGPQALEPFHGPPRGFSFAKEIQPILNRNCIDCHNDRSWASDIMLGKTVSGTMPSPGATTDNTAGSGDQKVIRAFSLLGDTVVDPYAKRLWSDAYLVLTQSRPVERKATSPFFGDYMGRLVNWVGAQSAPEPLAPYQSGSAKSALLSMLEGGHHGVRLASADLEKIACWIDLLVPYCGDYTEAHAWDETEQKRYAGFMEKRRRMESVERDNIAALLREKGP